jgi:hypothetical protein
MLALHQRPGLLEAAQHRGASWRTPATALILVVTYSYRASVSRHTTLLIRLADPVMAAANGTSACREISSPTAASRAGSTISHR